MIGDEIRTIREHRGMSQQDVAEACGLSRSALTAIESGRNYPTLAALEALAGCLRFTITIGPSKTTIKTLR